MVYVKNMIPNIFAKINPITNSIPLSALAISLNASLLVNEFPTLDIKLINIEPNTASITQKYPGNINFGIIKASPIPIDPSTYLSDIVSNMLPNFVVLFDFLATHPSDTSKNPDKNNKIIEIIKSFL